MLYYFYGPDTFGARVAIDELAKENGAVIHFLDKAELELKSLRSRLQAGGGLFSKTLLVVRDPSSLPVNMQREMVDLLAEKNSSDCILWERGKVDGKSVLVKAYKKAGRQFSYLSQGELVAWLQAQAKELTVLLERDAAEALVGRVGFDRWQLLNELKKMALVFPVITRAHVEQHVVAGTVTDSVFLLSDALMKGQENIVMKTVENLLTSGESELRLLALIAYQLRLLLVIQAGVKDRLSANEIAQRYSLNPYPVQKNMSVATRYNKDRLLDMYVRIMATDFAIKQGKVDAKTGLIMLLKGFLERQVAKL